MARCKQSSTRPPNCNFLCLILVTEWKKFNEYIYIFFSAFLAILFFRKTTFDSFLLLFLFVPYFWKDCSDCFQGLNYRCSKKISIFLLVRSIIFIQLQFSSCLNYFRIIQPQIYLFIHFSFLNFIDFITSIISMHFFFAQNLLRFHYPRDIKLDRIFENNQSSRWVSPNSNNFRPRQLFLSIRTCERYWYWPIFNEY